MEKEQFFVTKITSCEVKHCPLQSAAPVHCNETDDYFNAYQLHFQCHLASSKTYTKDVAYDLFCYNNRMNNNCCSTLLISNHG